MRAWSPAEAAQARRLEASSPADAEADYTKDDDRALAEQNDDDDDEPEDDDTNNAEAEEDF